MSWYPAYALLVNLLAAALFYRRLSGWRTTLRAVSPRNRLGDTMLQGRQAEAIAYIMFLANAVVAMIGASSTLSAADIASLVAAIAWCAAGAYMSNRIKRAAGR